jgi:hypothetical protein
MMEDDYFLEIKLKKLILRINLSLLFKNLKTREKF